MLQNMREKFTGTFAIVLLALIGLSFVFFGLNYSFIGTSYAAKVDGEKIDAGRFEQDYRNALQRNPQLASLTGPVRVQVRRNLLEQLIAQQLIENYLDEQGYRISDEQIMESIREQPEFQLDGRFDLDTYRTFLIERGMDPVRFEQLQRDALRQQQLQLAIGATALVTPAEYRRYLNLVAEQRVVTVASIGQDAVEDEIVVTDEMVTKYYDDNPALYELPESADVAYIRIDRDDLAGDVEVREEDLELYYRDNLDRYLQDEQRAARHILLEFGDDEAAARDRAQALLSRLEAGESFAALAAEASDDGGTAAAGGSLGTLTQSQLPGELGSAIFSMDEGEIEGPIETEFGFHIVRLDEILERGPLPLDQVRSELLSEMRERDVDERFLELERSLSDAVFERDEIEAIAEATGLEVRIARGITRAGGEPFGSNQAAIDAIFDELVLTGGQVSEVTELDANSVAIFQVVNYEPAKRQSLEEVREDVVATLRLQQAETILAGRAEQMLAAVEGGEDFAAAAAAAGFEVAEPQLLTRTDQEVDQALMFDAFAAGKPGEATPVIRKVRLQDGRFAVYSLDAVLPGRPESIPLAERDQRKLQLAQQSGIGDFQAFVRALHDDADIVVNADVLAPADLFQ